jgi:HK97 gp10 family phage protein
MSLKVDFPEPGVQQAIEEVSIINEKLNMHVGDFAAAQEIRDMAKDLAPVDTGHLRDSIRCWQTSEGATVTAGGVSNGPEGSRDVDYAVYVEFGTYKMAAQPYLRPAVDLAHLTKTIHDAIQGML